MTMIGKSDGATAVTVIKKNSKLTWKQRAEEVPVSKFDIDFHKFQISFDDRNDNMYIIIEKHFAYIGGGVSGDKKQMRRFHRIYKDVHRYYGVTAEDIKNKSKRYEQVIRALTR